MPHVVLLGDSVFDNATYVGGGPHVHAHLKRMLPNGWKATLCAVDGAVIDAVVDQVATVPPDATHVVISAGGNDAINHIDVLERPARSVAEVLDLLAGIGSAFEIRYREMLSAVSRLELPVTVCTIYNGHLPEPALQRRASTALRIFNDAILRAAFGSSLSVIDLRLVCSSPADYANPIEPSVLGGEKIARAIVQSVLERPGTRPSSRVSV